MACSLSPTRRPTAPESIAGPRRESLSPKRTLLSQPITSINIEVEPWSPEISARVGGRATGKTALLQQAIETARAEGRAVKISQRMGHLLRIQAEGTVTGRINVAGPEPQNVKPPTKDEINPDKFDPMKLIADLRAKSWRNYTVTEYRDDDTFVTKLGALVGNEDFMKTVTWDGDGNPISSPMPPLRSPRASKRPTILGFMEVAIPDVYKRRVTLYRAQGMTGMDLYYRLVIDNRPISFGGGKGVNRAAHLAIGKTKTRQQNRSKRKDRVRNLRRAA